MDNWLKINKLRTALVDDFTDFVGSWGSSSWEEARTLSLQLCLCLASVLTEQTSSECSLTAVLSLIIHFVPVLD